MIRVWLALAFWSAGAFLGAQTPPAAPGSEPASRAALPTLTNAVQVLSLSAAEAAKGFPVRLSAVVTCFDPRSSLFFVQDASAGIYIYDHRADGLLKVGQAVAVRGRSAAGQFSPIVAEATIKVLGDGTLPKPRAVAIEQLASGSEDAQWVEVEGTVRKASEHWGHWVLDLASGTSRLKVRVLEHRAGAETNLVAARIKARGVVGTHYNNKRQLTGFHLLVSSPDDLQIIEPAPPDPFSAPVQLSSALMNYARGRAAGQRVRVQGIVTLHWPGRALFVRDSGGGIRVETTQATPLKPGDVVDVVGFPARNGYTPVLEDAVFRRTGSSLAPQPVKTTIEQARTGNLDKELVQVDGLLIGEEKWQADQRVLVLQADNKVFYARRPPVSDEGREVQGPSTLGPRPSTLDWPVGSRVRVTGICNVELDEDLHPTAFDLWLRSDDDATLLARPAGWMISRLLWVAGALLGLVLIGLAWLAMLRRRVRQETASLRRSESQLEERYRELFANANDLKETLRQKEQRLRQSLAERERLGRDLHDNIIQSIYAVGLGLEDTRQRVREEPKLAESQLANAVSGLNQVIRDVRNFIVGLQPEHPAELELEAAFKALLWTIGYDPGCRFEFQVDAHAADRLDESRLNGLLHIAREAMSNSLRHAKAGSVLVALRQNHKAVHFEVRDDGRGFDPAVVEPSGYGLRNMSFRAQELGARLEVNSRPGQGTRVVVELPFKTTKDEADGTKEEGSGTTSTLDTRHSTAKHEHNLD